MFCASTLRYLDRVSRICYRNGWWMLDDDGDNDNGDGGDDDRDYEGGDNDDRLVQTCTPLYTILEVYHSLSFNIPFYFLSWKQSGIGKKNSI